jgi:hypothetical protein
MPKKRRSEQRTTDERKSCLRSFDSELEEPSGSMAAWDGLFIGYLDCDLSRPLRLMPEGIGGLQTPYPNPDRLRHHVPPKKSTR